MGDSVTSRTVRADDYGLSEETKRLRDSEQGRLTDHAYAEALRLLTMHRPALDRIAAALLDRETLSREELVELFSGVAPDSRSSDSVGVVRALATD
jgi:cell division protease FtsH